MATLTEEAEPTVACADNDVAAALVKPEAEVVAEMMDEVRNGNSHTEEPAVGEESNSSVEAGNSTSIVTASSGEATKSEEIGGGQLDEVVEAAAANASVSTTATPKTSTASARAGRKRGWDQLDDPKDPAAKRTTIADMSPAQREKIDKAKKFCAEQTAAFKASQMARQQAGVFSQQMPSGLTAQQLQLQKTLQTMQQNAQQNALQTLQNVQQQQAAQLQQAAVAQLQAQQQAAAAATAGLTGGLTGGLAGGLGALAGGLAGLAPGQRRMAEMQEQSQKQRAFQLMCRVYVGSINFDMKEDQVKQAFLPFGPIRSIDLAWDNVAMKHKGFAFVEYETPEAAQIALDQMNGVMLGGRNIKCGRPSSIPGSAPFILQLQQEAENFNRIYVAAIHFDLNETDVKSVFEAFGKIKEIQLPTDQLSGKHRGFAFIEYETKQGAVDAIASMNLFDLGGQFLRVGKCMTPPNANGGPGTTGVGGGGGVVGGVVPPASVAAAAANAANVPGAAQAQLAVSAIQSRLAGLDSSTAVSSAGAMGTGLPGFGGIGALGGLASSLTGAGVAGFPGLAGLAQLGQLGQLANAANLLRANLPGLAANLVTSQAQSQIASAHAAAAALTTSASSNSAPAVSAAGIAAAAAATAEAPKLKPEQNLSNEEGISISGTNERFMLMQKLQRNMQSTVVVLRDMVSVEDLDEELESEVTEECSRHGKVKRVVIYQERQGEEEDAEVIVKIFVCFAEHDFALAAIKALDNRWFGGRIIKAESYDEEKFEANDLSG